MADRRRQQDHQGACRVDHLKAVVAGQRVPNDMISGTAFVLPADGLCYTAGTGPNNGLTLPLRRRARRGDDGTLWLP
jgi:hypothetical protein